MTRELDAKIAELRGWTDIGDKYYTGWPDAGDHVGFMGLPPGE